MNKLQLQSQHLGPFLWNVWYFRRFGTFGISEGKARDVAIDCNWNHPKKKSEKKMLFLKGHKTNQTQNANIRMFLAWGRNVWMFRFFCQ
jgi:hypothetical protein